MTKEEFFQRFNADELERICTNTEFLNVLIADPLDLELAEDVADRILSLNPPSFLKNGAIGPTALADFETVGPGYLFPPAFHSGSRLSWQN